MGIAGWALRTREELRPFGESDCEVFTDGFWGQPVNTVSSLAFVAVGTVVLAGNRGGDRERTIYGLLAVATGAGSFLAHGPSPAWAGLVHDAPLVALLAYVATDAASDLAGRRGPAWWWIMPTAVVLAVSEISEPARIAAQSTVAAVAIGASLLRGLRRPRTRRTVLTALALLGTGALIGTLSRSGMPLCDPGAPIQGHAVWHVLAALAIWRLTPIIGSVPTRVTPQ